MKGNKQLIKTFETRNRTMAISLFRKYANPLVRTYTATISKKEGGDNSLIYTVQIFAVNVVK